MKASCGAQLARIVGPVENREEILWRPSVRLIIADVDDTIAPPFGLPHPEVRSALAELLSRGIRLLLVSGQSVTSIYQRVIAGMPAHLRRQVLVAHCNGAEVFGFDSTGAMLRPCVFSAVTSAHRAELRAVRRVAQIVLEEFHLTPVPSPAPGLLLAPGSPADARVVFDDRGVQISIDFLERLSGQPDDSLRTSVARRANELLRHHMIFAVEARLGGVSGLDFLVSSVHKGCPVRALRRLGALAAHIGLDDQVESEVWGDQFSISRHGADARMAMAVPDGTRVISFRQLPEWDLPPTRGMRVWPGPRYLDEGLLDYLRAALTSRPLGAPGM